jgi:hypothetical protein
MMALLARLAFRWRTLPLSRSIDRALAKRRRARPALRRAALKGWSTRFQRRMEGLKR